MAEGSVQVEKLSFAFIPGGQETLSEVSFALPAGARCVLVGQNGAGKSTLLEILAGNKMVPRDQVLVCEADPFRGASGKKVALVQGGWRGFGDRSADDRAAFMKVWELVGLPEPGGDAVAESPYVDRLLDALSLRVLLMRFFGSLSDGERRRVELARKLKERKSVVLLDEATTDLDLLARKQVMAFLREEAVTVVNATHVFDGLESWATHLLHLHQGRVVHFEQIDDAEPPPWDESSGLFGLVARWVGDGAVPAATTGESPAEASETTVEIDDLRFAYAPGSPCALRLDRLRLPSGCRCVLAGLNGSGKSTLLTVAAGRRMVANSEVKVLGLRAFYDHSKLDSMVTILSSEWKRQVSEISSGKSVTFPELANSFIQELVSTGLDMAMLSARMMRLIQMLGIDPAKPLGALSDGGMRRVQIALKLLRPSKLLLVDEVTADLDVVARAALLAFLREEALSGCSIVYCTHIFDGLAGWATHILRLRPGGHDGELTPFADGCSSAGSLVQTICDMLGQDSQLQPVQTELAGPAASNAAELPEGWGRRGNTQAGAYGDYAWNAEKGAEDEWSFGSVAPKPQNVVPGQMDIAPGVAATQFPGAPSALSGPSTSPFAAAPQPQGYPGAPSAKSSVDECPFGPGRSNQAPLEELMRRGIVQESPSMR